MLGLKIQTGGIAAACSLAFKEPVITQKMGNSTHVNTTMIAKYVRNLVNLRRKEIVCCIVYTSPSAVGNVLTNILARSTIMIKIMRPAAMPLLT